VSLDTAQRSFTTRGSKVSARLLLLPKWRYRCPRSPAGSLGREQRAEFWNGQDKSLGMKSLAITRLESDLCESRPFVFKSLAYPRGEGEGGLPGIPNSPKERPEYSWKTWTSRLHHQENAEARGLGIFRSARFTRAPILLPAPWRAGTRRTGPRRSEPVTNSQPATCAALCAAPRMRDHVADLGEHAGELHGV